MRKALRWAVGIVLFSGMVALLVFSDNSELIKQWKALNESVDVSDDPPDCRYGSDCNTYRNRWQHHVYPVQPRDYEGYGRRGGYGSRYPEGRRPYGGGYDSGDPDQAGRGSPGANRDYSPRKDSK